jgi:hypothetical protein
MITSRGIIPRMRNISDQPSRANQNTILCSVAFLFLETRNFYEIMWQNIVELD